MQRGRDARLGVAAELAAYRPDFFEDARRPARGRDRGRRGAPGRQRHRRPDHRRARGRDRDPRPTSRSGPSALRRSGTDTKWRELQSILDQPLMTDAAGNRRKLIIFTEPRDTLDLPRRQDPHPPRPRRGRASRSTAGSPARRGAAPIARLPARPGGPGHGRQRRRRRGRQPPARPPHGQLRPALEPEPPRAALRPHPPHRPDRGLPPVEPGRERSTREGEVYARLLEKLEAARGALGGRVYDVPGPAVRAAGARRIS